MMNGRRVLAARWLVCLVAFHAGSALAASEIVFDARAKEGEILTPLPGDAPRINRPRICGARPDKEFVYRIPCQGRRPIKFVVEDLPESLKLDAALGVIRGGTPARMGNYDMTLRATNGHGSDTRPFRLVVGERLALTPPTGYSSWGGWATST